MCRLLETIKIKDGAAYDLELHNRRANAARRILFGAEREIDLGDFISPARRADAGSPVRCRVIYAETVERVEYLPYRTPVIRTLKLVRADHLDYRYKYEDRSALTALLGRKGDSDEILIVRRGLVTDTSISNVVFFDGMHYVTPDEPLLAGVKREALLRDGRITVARITEDDIGKFCKVFLINSLIDMEDDVSISVKEIV